MKVKFEMRKDLCRTKLKWGFDFSPHASAVTLAQLIERRASDRKVAESRFDSRTGNTSLCFWERQICYLGPNILPGVVAQPNKNLVNK